MTKAEKRKQEKYNYHYARMKRFEFVVNQVLTDRDFAHYGRHDERLGITTTQKYELMKKCLKNIRWYRNTKGVRLAKERKRRYEQRMNLFIEELRCKGRSYYDAKQVWKDHLSILSMI